MKRTLLLIIFILSFLSATDAQWYNRTCGVIDINNTTSEEFECLWNKSTNMVWAGATSSGVGIPFLVIGFVTLNRVSIFSDAAGYAVLSVTIGLIMELIGIPTLIAGIDRKSQLKKNPNYEILNLGSLNLSPVIGLNQFNGTHYLGMSLSLNF